MAQYEKATDKAAFIAEHAILAPRSLCGLAMSFIWRHYGKALHDIAVGDTATGGVYIAGGSIRKNLPLTADPSQANPLIEGLIMQEFDGGPTHCSWVNRIPVYAITDAKIGFRGALSVATNPDYFAAERNRQR